MTKTPTIILISDDEARSDEWGRQRGVWEYTGEEHPKGYYKIDIKARGFSAEHLGSDLGEALKKIGLRPAKPVR